MPFREAFDCLWCGRPWTVRSPDDLEGFAQLCPDCLGKAGENEFIRFRLRAALEERSGAEGGRPAAPAWPASATGAPLDSLVDYYTARVPEYDDWYLRHGGYDRGPIDNTAWQADLDAAGLWLDALPFRGEIVELAAGTGWWSPLLASKGELWAYDAVAATLDRARERLLAHGLRAHLHVRDAWAEPDRRVDGVFCGFWLSHVARDRLSEFLGLVGRWLKPGGLFAFIDSLPDPASGALGGPPPASDRSTRRLADGREFTIVKVYRSASELAEALRAAGFGHVDVRTTSRFFVLGSARAGG